MKEITSQKKLVKVKNIYIYIYIYMTVKDKRPLLLFCFTDFEQI